MGSMITTEIEGENITRNSSFFKKLEPDVQVTVGHPVNDSLNPLVLPTVGEGGTLSEHAERGPLRNPHRHV